MNQASHQKQLRLPLISNQFHINQSFLTLQNSFETKKKLKNINLIKKSESEHLHFMSLLIDSTLKKTNIQDIELELKQSKINEDLNNQNEDIKCQQKSLKHFVGNKAISNYYKHYKKLTKIIDKEKIASTNNSPYTAILERSESLNTFPGCYGIIKNKGQKNSLHLENFKLGDKYTQIVSAGIKQNKQLQEYIFSKNRLTNKGFNQILNSINHQVTKLDFSNNQIKTIDQNMMKILTVKESKLQYLNLQNNKLGDSALQNLAFAISINKSLKYLNLNKNFLTKISGEYISIIIQKNNMIEELYLNWNKINGSGSKSIFSKLQGNKFIKVFDYSYNAIGLGKEQVSESIVSFLKKNKTLLHFDLSFNNFNLEQSKIIAEGLKNNRTIYGMHFSGNYGYVDSKGFLVFDNDQENTYHSIGNTRINGFEITFKRPTNTFSSKQAFKDVCWICEGWREFKIQKSLNFLDINQIYLHFSFQGYKPKYANFQNKILLYSIMIPPYDMKFFFSTDSQQMIFQDQDQSKIMFQTPINFSVKNQINLNLSGPIECNVINLQPNKLVNNINIPQISVLPRTPDLQQKKNKKKKIWHYRESVWAKEWKKQEPETTLKCFERDWSQSKISNIIKNQQDQDKSKDILYKNYKNIKQIYKYFAAWSPFGDVWAVSANPFTEFCNQAKLVSKQLPLKIIDLTFITTNSMSGVDWKGNRQVPERGLTRFQFMESIVRLADQKYRKGGLYQTMHSSIQAIINDHLQLLYPKFQSEQWREKIYFVEQNDILIRKFRPVFTHIYRKFSKLQVKPGQKPFMCLDEFKQICQRCGMFSGSTVERDCYINYNLSMITQIDEVTNERIYKMTQIEFIEALARMSNQLCLNNLSQITQTERLNRPLYYKFEQLIYQLLKNLCSEQIRNQFAQATVSIFKELKEKQNEQI